MLYWYKITLFFCDSRLQVVRPVIVVTDDISSSLFRQKNKVFVFKIVEILFTKNNFLYMKIILDEHNHNFRIFHTFSFLQQLNFFSQGYVRTDWFHNICYICTYINMQTTFNVVFQRICLEAHESAHMALKHMGFLNLQFYIEI